MEWSSRSSTSSNILLHLLYTMDKDLSSKLSSSQMTSMPVTWCHPRCNIPPLDPSQSKDQWLECGPPSMGPKTETLISPTFRADPYKLLSKCMRPFRSLLTSSELINTTLYQCFKFTATQRSDAFLVVLFSIVNVRKLNLLIFQLFFFIIHESIFFSISL